MSNEMNIELNKLMGFAINGVPIPDPSSYGYSSQSLDVSAERDTRGLLHRKMVDTKFNVSFSWNAMDYATATSLLNMVAGESFTLTFPCPELPPSQNHGLYTGKYYCGDRKVEVLKASDDSTGKWIVSLGFDCIEF